MIDKTGGPAFPCTAEQSPSGVFPSHGMTLRDYFAAKALQGQMACVTADECMPDKLAEWSYRYADAMLKEREK